MSRRAHLQALLAGSLVLLAIPAPAREVPTDGARSAPAADTVLPAWIEADAARPGDTIRANVFIDLSSVDDALGSYDADVRFDPAVLGLLDAGPGDFEGSFETNLAAADTGAIPFAGASSDTLANLDTTRIAELTFEVVGAGGAASPLDLGVGEVSSAGDFADLSSYVTVADTSVLVNPGPIHFRLVGSSTLSTTSAPVDLRVLLHETVSSPEAARGRLTFDPTVVRVDSIVAGGFGGTVSGNVGMQADSGFVRWAVANSSPPAVDSTELVRFWVTAVGSEGSRTTFTTVHEELVNGKNLASLLPFVGLNEDLAVVYPDPNAVWGDVAPDTDSDGDTVNETFDGVITAKDVLAILSHVVGLALPAEFDITAGDVAPDIDADRDGTNETFDGTITSQDVLAVLSHIVLKTLPPEFRVGDPR